MLSELNHFVLVWKIRQNVFLCIIQKKTALLTQHPFLSPQAAFKQTGETDPQISSLFVSSNQHCKTQRHTHTQKHTHYIHLTGTSIDANPKQINSPITRGVLVSLIQVFHFRKREKNVNFQHLYWKWKYQNHKLKILLNWSLLF